MAVVRQIIQITPSSEGWPHKLAVLGRALRQALSAEALRIDHIGSTSVPGLAAKDVIDIQITIAALEPTIREALQAVGHMQGPHFAHHIPPGAIGSRDDWVKWVLKELAGRRPTNVHVRVAGRPNQRLPLPFLDLRRSNEVGRGAYQRVKVALARLHPGNMDAYTAVKDPVCDTIFEAAEAWATSTHWAPGPSDA